MTFDLPPRAVFEPPQYPNVWLYVDERLATSQDEAVRWLTGWVRERCGIVDDLEVMAPGPDPFRAVKDERSPRLVDEFLRESLARLRTLGVAR